MLPGVASWLVQHNHLFYLFIFAVLGLELKAYNLSPSTSPFLRWVFFEIGSHKLFAHTGFEQ
jgi:hypothetical protein